MRTRAVFLQLENDKKALDERVEQANVMLQKKQQDIDGLRATQARTSIAGSGGPMGGGNMASSIRAGGGSAPAAEHVSVDSLKKNFRCVTLMLRCLVQY
jgi:hypothetical protein